MRAHVLGDFEESLMNTTAIQGVVERLYDPFELHRQRVGYVLDHLADRLPEDAPLFVFAHIICPHPPFVFGPDGAPVRAGSKAASGFDDSSVGATSDVDRDAVVKGYRDQVRFVNRRIEGAVETILARARRPPIIILQGDHGPHMMLDESNPSAVGMSERMSILNAYYVPREIRTRLYSRITPVNTFRIIFGQYFHGPSGLLPDDSFFSTWKSPYAFVPVNQVTSSEDRAAPGRSISSAED
jgi:hypothetical protein